MSREAAFGNIIKKIAESKNKEENEEIFDQAKEELSLEEKYKLKNQYDVKNRIREIFQATVPVSLEGYEKTDVNEILRKLSNWGKIFFDLNGLKAINDFSSHRQGDIFLDQTAQILAADPELARYCQENGLTIDCLAREGGDEFSFIIEIAEEIQEENKKTILAGLIGIVSEKVSQMDSSFIDFQTEETKDSLGELGLELLAKAGGEDYAFSPSIAGGGCLFSESFGEFLDDYKLREDEKIGEAEFFSKIMGATQDLADKHARVKKEHYKRMLRNSGDPQEVFTSFLLTRTAEGKELLRELEEYKQALRACEDHCGKKFK